MVGSEIKPEMKVNPVRDEGGGWPIAPLWPDMSRMLEGWMPSAFALPTIFGTKGAGFVDLKTDIAESSGEIEITVEVPGVEEKDIELSVADDLLTVRGRKTVESEDQKKDYHLVERRYGSFSRSFRLPKTVDQTKIAAKFDNGVLHITVPKSGEGATPERKIPVGKK